VIVKGIIRRITLAPATRQISILPSFVAMYTILTEMLNIIEDIMKTISIDLPTFNDLDWLIILPNKF
jgi:hypothetical protein